SGHAESRGDAALARPARCLEGGWLVARLALVGRGGIDAGGQRFRRSVVGRAVGWPVGFIPGIEDRALFGHPRLTAFHPWRGRGVVRLRERPARAAERAWRPAVRTVARAFTPCAAARAGRGQGLDRSGETGSI